MGILVVTWNFPPRKGGIETLMGGLCEGLKKRHRLYVVTSRGPVPAGQEDWLFRARWPGLWAFAVYAIFRGGLILWRDASIRIVFGGSGAVTPLILLLARIFRRKAFVQVHGLDLIYANVLYQNLCVRWLKHCDWVVANSRYTASLAVKSKVKPASLEVIHPGVDWEKFSASHRRAERKDFSLEGRRVILFVGRLARRKGMKEFIDRCFDQIVREVPDVCLVIVGENPTDSMVHRDDVSSEIQALVQGKNLVSHVRFLGWLAQADMAGIYGVSDVMVVPAVPVRGDVEGFGIVLLEAGAAAVPSVAFRVGGIPDAIGDGRGGVLIEPGDYDRMSQAIIHLLRNDQARASMGRHAQKRIRDDFGWETTAQRYEALFLKSQRQGGS